MGWAYSIDRSGEKCIQFCDGKKWILKSRMEGF